MPQIECAELGSVEYCESDLYHFPEGLPAFEHLRKFVLAQQSALMPLVFLVSAECPGLRFICVPVELLVTDYELELGEKERALLGLDNEDQSKLVLAVLAFPEGQKPTANLVAPVVLTKGVGLQVVQAGTSYSVVHPLAGVAQS